MFFGGGLLCLLADGRGHTIDALIAHHDGVQVVLEGQRNDSLDAHLDGVRLTVRGRQEACVPFVWSSRHMSLLFTAPPATEGSQYSLFSS